MSATLKNLSGYTWGCASETTNGVSVTGFDQKSESEILRHKDHVGKTIGKVFSDERTGGTLTGVTTGAPTIAIADSITMPNEIATLGGVTGGTTLVHTVAISKGNEALQTITIEWERCPGLTVA
jgi:hypothetical protein